jgi:hypothetical protein
LKWTLLATVRVVLIDIREGISDKRGIGCH